MKSTWKANVAEHSAGEGLRHPQRVSLLAALAIVGQLCLFASAWLLPLVSEFSLIGDHISELVLGRYGVVQTAAFVLAGPGTLCLAFVIRQLTAGTWGRSGARSSSGCMARERSSRPCSRPIASIARPTYGRCLRRAAFTSSCFW